MHTFKQSKENKMKKTIFLFISSDEISCCIIKKLAVEESKVATSYKDCKILKFQEHVSN